MVKYFVGIVGALLGALAGAWLMVSPFALAFQPEGADWIDATHVNFWTGLGLVLVSVAGLAMYAIGLVGDLRRRGVLQPRESADNREPEASRETGASDNSANGSASGQNGGVSQESLTPLIAEILRDLQQERRNAQESYEKSYEKQEHDENYEQTRQDGQREEGRVSR